MHLDVWGSYSTREGPGAAPRFTHSHLCAPCRLPMHNGPRFPHHTHSEGPSGGISTGSIDQPSAEQPFRGPLVSTGGPGAHPAFHSFDVGPKSPQSDGVSGPSSYPPGRQLHVNVDALTISSPKRSTRESNRLAQARYRQRLKVRFGRGARPSWDVTCLSAIGEWGYPCMCTCDAYACLMGDGLAQLVTLRHTS